MKNSKKAARPLRTRTARPLGEPDGLGRRGFVHFVRSGNFLYRRSSAFIGGQYGVFVFALDRGKKHIWPPMNA
ncbi:MAG: hypothetical protein ABSG56_22475, partial [Bryobacteraceae bacterium]